MIELVQSIPYTVLVPILLVSIIFLGTFFFFAMSKVWESLTGDKNSLNEQTRLLTISMQKLELQMEKLNDFLNNLKDISKQNSEDLDYLHNKTRSLEDVTRDLEHKVRSLNDGERKYNKP